MTELVAGTIKYDFSVGINGARFVLIPLAGFHNYGDIKKAKNELYRDHDVLSISTDPKKWEEWKEVKVWFHPLSAVNNALNVEFHDKMYEQYKKAIDPGGNEETS